MKDEKERDNKEEGLKYMNTVYLKSFTTEPFCSLIFLFLILPTKYLMLYTVQLTVGNYTGKMVNIIISTYSEICHEKN